MLSRILRTALRGRRRWLLAYLAALLLSHFVIAIFDPSPFGDAVLPPEAERIDVDTPAMNDAGPAPSWSPLRISMARWPGDGEPAKPPIVLLHGSPSTGAEEFRRLAPLLTGPGRDVYVFESPGFGDSSGWAPSYSNIATARTMLAAMDELGLDRAHIVGWSFGGGVGLQMADLAPERLASLTLLAALGAQETEGSGDYYFERGKYIVGYLVFVAAPELIPHFGLLGRRAPRHAFIRNFWDTDLRPVRAQMERTTTPTLILHGRRDILTPAWGAELHHAHMPTSRLVMLPGNHWMPFTQPQALAEHIEPFVRRHDDIHAPPLLGVADFAPTGERHGSRIGRFEVVHGMHWALLILIIILCTFLSEDATVIAVGILIASGDIDPGVGFLGCLIGIIAGDALLWSIGRFAGKRALRWPMVRAWLPEKSVDRIGRLFDKHAVKAVFLARAVPGTRLPTYVAAGVLSGRSNRFIFWAILAALLWTPLLLTLAAIFGPVLLRTFESVMGKGWALIAALAVLFIAIRTIELAWTRLGRLRLITMLRRPFRSEFWPPWIFYVPLVPWLLWLALRRGGGMTFTCANPGISCGGGVVDESKHAIFEALERSGASPWLCPTAFIPASGRDASVRTDEVDHIISELTEFPGYPVVLKPDAAQRGHGVKVARSREQIEKYFQLMTRPAILQPVHPGRLEVGVLWARRPGARDDEPGFIFSITRKVFPVIEGDGKRTLEELIWRHPRFSMQARTFLKRHADQADRILFKGETLKLAFAGNHCQGTMFLDGADLITPQLTKRIDAIARAYPGGLDFGRFDLRYDNDDELRRGEGFGIIELNGVMSESTNLYDPGRSLLWRYRVLFAQWALLYELGAHRRRQGVRPIGFGELISTIRDHYRGRPGSAVSD